MIGLIAESCGCDKEQKKKMIQFFSGRLATYRQAWSEFSKILWGYIYYITRAAKSKTDPAAKCAATEVLSFLVAVTKLGLVAIA